MLEISYLIREIKDIAIRLAYFKINKKLWLVFKVNSFISLLKLIYYGN